MTRNIDLLTLERLREVLDYDPKTGLFMWRKRLSPRCKLDQPAGDVKGDGYRKIVIDGRSYHASHLAWFHYYGERPARLIDHENTIKRDDRIQNLRLATHSENSRNQGARSGSLSGLKGASKFYGKYNKEQWRSSITVDGERIFLGLFMTAQEAHQAYCNAAAKLHGEFANTGVPMIPSSIRPAFIGRLIEKAKDFGEDDYAFQILWTFIGQCRSYNEDPDDLPGRERLLLGMRYSRELLFKNHGVQI